MKRATQKRRRAKSRTRIGIVSELDRWFRARVKRRKAKRKLEDAGRKAARKGRR